jgi:hypothetical protein
VAVEILWEKVGWAVPDSAMSAILDSPLNRVWTASPTESVLVKRTDVQRAAKVGYHQVAPAGATRFWQRTLAFYFSEFSNFLTFLLGGES